MTFHDYLYAELLRTDRQEFLDGREVPRAAPPPGARRLVDALRDATAALDGRVLGGDVLVGIRATHHARYVDASYVCDEIDLYDSEGRAVANPCLIAELRCPGWTDADVRERLDDFAQIDALRVYLSVEEERTVVFDREGDGWRRRDVGRGEDVLLGSIGSPLRVTWPLAR